MLHVKEMTRGTREVFQYAICANCGSTYITNSPNDISRYYEDYYSFQDNVPSIDRSICKLAVVAIYSKIVVRSGLSFLVRQFFRCPSPWQMKLLSPNLQTFLFLGAKGSARILDVGCGSGQFVNMMRRFGYVRAVGIDPFLENGFDSGHVLRSDIFSVTESYDVILFNHSLEHMIDPEAALKKCAGILAQNGVILIHIPNLHSREFPKFRQNWCWMHAPYHFAIPSRRGIELLAEKCGFKIIDAICSSRPDHYLYSDEYSRDIPDNDSNSARRQLENGSFDKKRYLSLSELAQSLNKTLTGDWIAYYLARS